MKFSRKYSVAPMLKRTDQHCRYLHRLINPSILLYTEMVTTGAILFGDKARHLNFNEIEHPLALQLGGSDPRALAHCAKLAEERGYDEVNLNVGCPSDRVQSGSFGACLMKTPEIVANGVSAMMEKVSIPVTVKTRIGVDEQDSYAHLCDFIKIVSEAGCQSFTLHARKAWLQGLSPKENRTIPPLKYDLVYQLKRDFPTLEIIINGGIKTQVEIEAHLKQVDGVMLGRVAYQDPYLLASLAEENVSSREVVLAHYKAYMEGELKKGLRLSTLVSPLLGLYFGQPEGKVWRRKLGEARRIENI